MKNELLQGGDLIVLGLLVIIHSDHEKQTIVIRYCGFWTPIEQIIQAITYHNILGDKDFTF